MTGLGGWQQQKNIIGSLRSRTAACRAVCGPSRSGTPFCWCHRCCGTGWIHHALGSAGPALSGCRGSSGWASWTRDKESGTAVRGWSILNWISSLYEQIKSISCFRRVRNRWTTCSMLEKWFRYFQWGCWASEEHFCWQTCLPFCLI